jgi:hypothetical protein
LIAFVPSLDLAVTRQAGGSGAWGCEGFLRLAGAALVQAPPERPASDVPGGRVTAGSVLGVRDNRFTQNGEPTFLLGMSYYGALGAPEDFVRHDLDDLTRNGFNWLRVWATWSAFDRDVSAVDAEGRPREPFLGRLKWLVAECDRRGLLVDVTLTRGEPANGGAIPNLQAHHRAVETLVGALKGHRNWYLDLANERDVRDARHVSADELKALREQVRKLDPERLVTASFGGHDLDEADLKEAVLTIGLDFVAPHRPRDADSAGQTEVRTRACLATMRKVGRSVPVQYQEPFLRGYGRWQPTASDFLTDLRGALDGGAAGWCLHNGSSRGAPEERPRRSFDLHARRLFDQLDEEERKVVARAAAESHRAQPRSDLEFRHHFASLDLPSDRGQGDYGLTALADLDRDGDLDFVCGGRIPRPERLYWFEYRGPEDWVRHDVGTDYRSDVGLAALDVDGDGWFDLVCSGVWYRNPGKPRDSAFERISFAEKAAGAHDILVADVDGDRRADVLMMGDGRTALNALCWFSIPADPRQPWVRHEIGPGIHGAITPAGAFDIDGDSDLDVARGDTWYENRDGKGLDWRPHKDLPMGRSGPYGICVRSAVADLDGDGRPELVLADADIAESKVAVLWNRGGKGTDWRKRELPQSFRYGSLHALAVADLNGDGRPDIVANEQEELMPEGRGDPRWIAWENLGDGRFAERILLDQRLGGHELQVGDVDGDGDIDIVSKPWSASPGNGADGKIHVDYLENRTKP